MRRRRRQKHASDEQAGRDPTLAGLLALAQERVAEIEAVARRSHEDLERMATEMGVEELLTASPGARERLGAEVVGSVTERIAGLYEEAAALVAVLERSTTLLSPEDEEPAAQREWEVQAESTLPPEPAERVQQRETPVSEGVRLLATQMAVAGSSRSEIEDRLRSELNVRDPEALVDEVLGSAVYDR